MNRFLPLAPVLLLICLLPAAARGQASADLIRANPKFLQAFRDAVAGPGESTVRVRCDGKDVALGLVVGADGWVLTKAHDLCGAVTCRLKDDRELEAKIVGVHEQHDLALLKLNAFGLSPAKLRDAKGVAAGSWVASPGLGADPVAVGVVSVGPRDLPPMPAQPEVKAGYLGVTVDNRDGVRVTQVTAGTAAALAGLEAGDVILDVGGTKVEDTDQFVRLLTKCKAGDEVTFRVRRDQGERDVKATLQARPAGVNRVDLQNHMGSELSARRTGYATVLQHDSVVKPTDCGGPLVDLDGQVIGVNVCRAGRVETWAVPSEVVKAVLPALKSGKLAPTPEFLDRTRAKLNAASVEALLSAMNRRLLLMEEVARAKWNDQRLARDARREAAVLERMAEEAGALGLDADDARRFFAAQVEAAWKVQENLFAAWKEEGAGRFDNTFDLAQLLRPMVDRASNELLQAYAKVRPFLAQPECQKLLRERAPITLSANGVDAAVRDAALGTIFDPGDARSKP